MKKTRQPESRVVAMCSAKGGVGKSTLTVATGSELALIGFRVHVIDCDKSGDSSRWVKDAGIANLTAISLTDPAMMRQSVEWGRSAADVVLIDLPGELSEMMTFAMVRSDFVVVPTKCSEFDLHRMSKSVTVMRQTAENINREIPYKVLLNDFPHLNSRAARDAEDYVASRKLPCFRTRIMKRTAFERIVNDGQPIRHLDSAGTALGNLTTFLAELAREVNFDLTPILAHEAFHA
jgi:chromosome partitioning protein